jgi:hypothetical protein
LHTLIDLAGLAAENEVVADCTDEMNALAKCRKIAALRKSAPTLSDAVTIKENLRKIARRLVNENRRQIEAVARELLRRGSLDQNAIDALMESAS